MAVSNNPVITTGAVVVAFGTSVAPTTAQPENCHTVIILNRGPVDGLYGRGAPGGALVERVSGNRLVAGGSITLALGTALQRGIMDQAAVVGSGLVYDGVGGNPSFDITYLQDLRGGS